MLDQIPENVGDLTNHEIDEILDKLVKLTKVHRYIKLIEANTKNVEIHVSFLFLKKQIIE